MIVLPLSKDRHDYRKIMGQVGRNVHIIQPANERNPPQLLSPRIISAGPEFVCVILSKMGQGVMVSEAVFLKITEIYFDENEARKDFAEIRRQWKAERDLINKMRKEIESDLSRR